MTDVEDVVVAAWRREAPALVGALVRLTRDLQLAEDLAQDALVAALEQWPDHGIPARPGAWLMTVAKRRAVDAIRRAATLRDRTERIAHDLSEQDAAELVDSVDVVEDDVLRLMFLTCHPALTADSRVALTLRLVGGLTTAEIARALLARESAVAQRISRAKQTLRESGADLAELPTGAERSARVADVASVVYLVFNEGYAATAGERWTREELCREALRLAGRLAHLAPGEPEVHGLEALLALQSSRLRARYDDSGAPVLLEEQDRSRWDRLLVRRGLAALGRAHALGRPVGSYVLQAEIAACHARARRPEDTDWVRIAGWYGLLARHAPGPVVELNRAVAHGRAFGPAAGLALLDGLGPGVPAYRVAAVRGDLLARAGDRAGAAAAFRTAAAGASNAAERDLLRRRAEEHAEEVDAAMSRTGDPVRRLVESDPDGGDGT